MFAVPTILPPNSTLDFDQICITEATYDFGIVEISKDEGQSWTELARYDQTAYPEWGDDVAGPTDWKHETLDLAAFAHQAVMVRFRLYTDTNLDKDGWYLDNVRINQAGCGEVTAVGGGEHAPRFALRAPVPNPVRAEARMAFTLPRGESRVELSIYDVLGRARRTVKLGPLAAGSHSWVWDGRDSDGRPLASGAYFARLSAGGETRVQKLLKLAP
jgi:bacillopeptidase F (M6 metalloprotease family)